MDVKFIDNINFRFLDELVPQIESSRQLNIAVAFARQSGFKLIEKPFIKFLSRNGYANFIIRLDFQTTDPAVLQELYSLSNKFSSFELICFRRNFENIAAYHPKMYLFNQMQDDFTAIIGSSNLTFGGMVQNIEANVMITSPKENLRLDLMETFFRLKTSELRIIPNKEYIEAYTDLYA
ncbi:MAG: NgoFVII family restriction endonuclease, partial [Anaerolineaceae bacterium]|nr:NgoFVII family restriction endonuclease [Anaerolineaceae bacterium]